MSTSTVRVHAFTHPGAVREANEDRVVVADWTGAGAMSGVRASSHEAGGPFGVLVCDGMGGHEAGEVASDLAAARLGPALSVPGGAASISAALQDANRAVFVAAEEPGRGGMGTTAAGLYFGPTGLFWFNVGDSRVFRYRDGFLRQLSVDDVGPTGGLTQALGGAESYLEVEPHVAAEPLTSGWRYLVCSDGLTDMVDSATIEAVLGDSPEVALGRLFKAAMAAGGRDNISMILISVGEQP